jgi:hypothetical protein
MTTISIEGGTVLVSPGVYKYSYDDVEGFHTITFTASQKPKVGDSVVDGVLVPLVGFKINGDVSRWLPASYDTWPDKPPV